MNKGILFVIPHLYGGGAERVVSLWASQLAQTDRYDVHILVSGRMPNEYPIDKNVTITAIAPTYDDYEKLSIFTKLKHRRKLIKKIWPDYIVSFLPHIQIQTFLATIGLRCKRIETIRVSPWVLNLKGLNKILFNLCLKMSHRVVLQTNEQREFFCPQIQNKCIVIHNPLDDRYSAIGEKQQSESVSHFMAAGRIVPQKNYSMMIRAFALAHKEHPNITLDIFGDGERSELDQLTNLIEQLDLSQNIQMRGRCNNMIEEYLCHDAFLMASDFEGMPNALLEAMAAGMVCLSTNCKTGPKDMIVHGESGYLSPIHDVDSYSNLIKKIICMTQVERLKMGEAARKKITTMCSSENTLKNLLSIFE